MRVHLFTLMFLSAAVMFSGCSGDVYNTTSDEKPVSFKAEICNRAQTRAVVDTANNSGTNLIVQTAEPAKGITLSVSKLTRTSTADGSWPSGANIAVQQNGTTKQYIVDGSGNITSSSPFYWVNKNDVSVTSWYPYSASLPTTWAVNSDQSTEANYGSSDLLYASNTFTYGAGNNNTLQYSHQTAKVVINVVKANDVTSASNISFVTIGTSGTPIDLSGTVGSDGAITATTTTTGYITPYQTLSSTYAVTYSALVIPQDMINKHFIAIKVAGGNTFYYMPSTSISLSGGYVYTYNVTVPSSTTNVGDYYFSDGSWGTLAVHATSTVKPIGVIFSNSPSTSDQGYGWKHGYAMALANTSTSCTWGTYGTDETALLDYQDTYTTYIINKDGYTETHEIKNAYPSTLQSTYPAFYYALNYSIISPNGSSGWYLPSIGQWWNIVTNLGDMSSTPTGYGTGIDSNWLHWYKGDKSGDTEMYSSVCADNINIYLENAANESNVTVNYFLTNSAIDEIYWSSTESDSSYAHSTHFYVGGGSMHLGAYKDDETGLKSNSYMIRPVISF